MNKILLLVGCLILLFLAGCERKVEKEFGRKSCATQDNVDFTGCISGYLYATVNIHDADFSENSPRLRKKSREENKRIKKEVDKEIDEFTKKRFEELSKYTKDKGVLGWHYLDPIAVRAGIEGNLNGSFEGVDGLSFGYSKGQIDGHLEDNIKVFFLWKCAGKKQVSQINIRKVYFVADASVKRPVIRLRYNIDEVRKIREEENTGHIAHPNEFVAIADEATIRILPEQMGTFLSFNR